MVRLRYSMLCWSAAVCVVFAASGTVRAAQAGRVDYGRDVLPILSDNCYHCHGPDENARKARLRLDQKEGAFRTRKDKTVIVPGKPAQSELVRRITSKDPDEVMPPPDSNRRLTGEQIELLRRWVEQGATWGVHWAFEAPNRPELPKTARQGWMRNGIDAFVLARLEQEGFGPSEQATKERLIRRVTFDLTGLPPTLAEIDAFVADPSPDAYEKVVDRLLASARYGERMAADWLDIARYADTHGYQMDRYRPMWPYRDWVIKAFNANLPFDEFITWQVAGDLLPNATKEQRLATAFNRLHMQNEEGGIVEEEFRVAYVVDRVNTLATAFLGLTTECSRCHDHKFDPLTQKDFYSLFAFFQNIDESGQTTYFTEAMPVPTLLLSSDEQDAKLAELKGMIEAKAKELEAIRGKRETAEAFEEWLKGKGELPKALPGLVAAYDFEGIEKGKVANAADAAKPANAVEGPKLVEGKVGKAAKLSGENGFTFPGVGHFTRADAFSLALWVRTPDHAARSVVVHHSRAPIDAGSRGYELLLEEGKVALGLHHMWPGNSLKVVTKQAVAINEWTHVTATYDGSGRASGIHIYVNGSPAEFDVIRDGLWKDITYGGGEPELAIGYRFRDNGFKGGAVDEFRVFNRAITQGEAGLLAGRKELSDAWAATDALNVARRAELLEYFLCNVYESARTVDKELHALRDLQNKLITPIPEAMVMNEMERPKPAFILKRGAYDAPGEQVSAETPAFLPPMSKEWPRNRLGLARWLISGEQPLTSRVIVNRAWQQMFGRGIVETSDNFGSQGTPPTHPELLDWLAREFAGEMRWDMKRLLKTIATSATYRQSSRASGELLARDPANQLLGRGPARRLSAEMLRDQALADGGLLAEKLGGPSVKPYQPEGLWDVAMGRPKYDQSHGEDLYRRSLYTFWKRTVPPPTMMTFDSADRSNCAARRQSTSTPLQALALLNDVQVVEAARHVSERMLKEGGKNVDERVGWAFRLVTGRPASEKELAVLRRLYEEQRELFAAEPKAAEKLLTVGEAKVDAALDRVDLAAGTVLAQALLNHDEAVMRR